VPENKTAPAWSALALNTQVPEMRHASGGDVRRCAGVSDAEAYQFADDGRFPNSALPVLVYRRALSPDPAAMERVFAAHDWSNGWRNGIFGYYHFHSTAHEVLGIAAGAVQVAFGGPSGQEVTVRAGDVVVVPAGVAHRNMGQSADLLVIGAYPGGSDYDIRRGDPAEHAAAVRAIAAVPLPKSNPVLGRDGCLRRRWSHSGAPLRPGQPNLGS